MGSAPVVLNSYNFSLKISTISSSCKSRTSTLTLLSAHPATKSSKKTVLWQGEEPPSLRKTSGFLRDVEYYVYSYLDGGVRVLIFVKNDLTYTSLSTQSLSSLDPSSDYLAITVKIKGTSPIHLFNVYVPPIRSSSSDSRPKSFSPFLLPSSPTTYIFGDFNGHHSSWESHSPEDQSAKDLFYWLFSSDLLPLNTPNITPYYTVPPETGPPLISLWSRPK